MALARRIPATMATQHPDNACSPYWLSDASDAFAEFASKLSSHGTRMPFKFVGGKFVTTNKEIDEAFLCFSELKCEEYLWDWEGKHADETVIEKLYEKYADYFSKKPIGKDFTLSFRIPNVWKETNYRIAHAFVSILSANDFAHDCGLHEPPIVETYLPMTTSADQLLFVQDKYEHIANAFQAIKKSGPATIDVIPLIEEVPLMTHADAIVEDYVRLCRERKRPVSVFSDSDMRVWFARSDPAMNAGLVPAVISVKAGMARLDALSEKTGVTFHPMIGVGCLPFRGGLSPESVDAFVKEYEGMRTATVQSAFRYDYAKPEVVEAVGKLNRGLKAKAQGLNAKALGEIEKLISIFIPIYQQTVEGLAEDINAIAKAVPERRERKLHTGLFGYSRELGKHKLPRAIKFTAALYSLGVPPELIGTGRGIAEAKKQKLLGTLEETYVNLREDLEYAGRFLNKENLASLAKSNAHYKAVATDVELVEDYLGHPLQPQTTEQYLHRNITSNILILYRKQANVEEDVVRAAEVRHSLG
jgi:phosphoenolpyruvate carboxylase